MNIDKAIAKEHIKIDQALLRLQILRARQHARQHAGQTIAAWGDSEECSLDEVIAAAAKMGFTIRTGSNSALQGTTNTPGTTTAAEAVPEHQPPQTGKEQDHDQTQTQHQPFRPQSRNV